MKKSHFQKQFARLLANSGHSLTEIIRETGISGQTINGWLKDENRTPQWATLVKISGFFGVSPEFMAEEGAADSPPSAGSDQHARITKLEVRLASAEGRIAELESLIRTLIR